MQKLRCQFAINLGSGEFPTLWLGPVVNKTIGDNNENNELKTIRPISDAIVFIKK